MSPLFQEPRLRLRDYRQVRDRVVTLGLLLLLFSPARAQKEVYFDSPRSVKAFQTPILFGAASGSSGLVAVSSSERGIKIYDVQTIGEVLTVESGPARVSALRFSPSGTVLLVGSADGQVHVVDARQGTVTTAFKAHSSSIVALDVVGDRFILSVALDRILRIFDATSGRTLASASASPDEVTALAVDPRGMVVVTGSATGQVRVYRVPQLVLAGSVLDVQDRIVALSFSSDGRFLVVGGASGKVGLFDAQTWKPLMQIPVRAPTLLGLALDPSARWVVTVSSDSTLRVHSLSTASLLKSLKETSGFSPFVSFAGEETLCYALQNGELRASRVLETPPDSVPPVIIMLRPSREAAETGAQVFGDRYRVEAIIADANELQEVSVNGVEMREGELSDFERMLVRSDLRGKKFSVEVSLPTPGIHEVVLTATDVAGNTASAQFSVKRLTSDEALEVLAPRPNTETDKVALVVEFKPWFDVASYSLSVNMIEVTTNNSPLPWAAGTVYSEEVPLLMGYNQVQLSVTDRQGTKFTKTLGVTRKVLGAGVPAAGVAGTVPKERGGGPQKWAVVVGVSEYEHPGIRRLNYADRDAQAFAAFLQRPEGGGFEPDRMRILINKDATLANIRDALLNFLRNAIDMDRVIIFFAGHGAPEPARPDNLYLLAHDTDPNLLATTAFPMWDIQTAIARYITAKQIIVFSDACHSGGISVDYATRGMGITESNLINQYLTDLSRTKEGTIVFTASAAGEVSQEYPELNHGVFTYYLLRGMEGEADLNNDYTVTINELMQYVEEQVKRRTKGAQNPTRSQTRYDKEMTISLIPH